MKAARRAMFCAVRYRPRADVALRALATVLVRPNPQKMVRRVLRHPRTPLDHAILYGEIPIDLR
jgi:hypothetical protein